MVLDYRCTLSYGLIYLHLQFIGAAFKAYAYATMKLPFLIFRGCNEGMQLEASIIPVSYTHLDVYKRQKEKG